MKTIIAGSRNLRDYDQIEKATTNAGWKITEVVSGKQKSVDPDGTEYGADFLGEVWATNNDIPVMPFPANWEKHGRAAGPIRNRQMAEYADALIAVWDGVSRGTKNMIREAHKRGLKIHVHYLSNDV